MRLKEVLHPSCGQVIALSPKVDLWVHNLGTLLRFLVRGVAKRPHYTTTELVEVTNPETKSPQSEKTNTDSWPKQCCWISIGLVLDWGLWFSAVLIPLVQVGRDGGWRSKQRKEKNLLRLLNSCQGWENSHWPVDLAAIRVPSPGSYLTSRLCSYTNSKTTKLSINFVAYTLLFVPSTLKRFV